MRASRGRALPWAFGILGLLMAFHPTILSGFREFQTDPGDTRLVHFILEHGWRWLSTNPFHRSFFNPDVFHPIRNTLAYSEVLLGAAPIYWLFRALGLSADPAYVLWVMSCLALDFAAMRFFLRRGLGYGRLGSSLGAFLFAYGASRVQQLGHQQLLPNFGLPLLALASCRSVIEGPEAPAGRRRRWLAIIIGSATWQVLAGFYLGWFTLLGFGAVLVWALADPRLRPRIIGVLRLEWKAIVAFATLAALTSGPMLLHYLQAARAVGTRSISQIFEPKLQSWLYLGDRSWLYSWQERVRMFMVINEAEQRIGVGLLTLGLALAGLYRGLQWRRSAPPRLGGAESLALAGRRALAGGTFIIFIATTSLYRPLFLWPVLFHVIPGANAIRALSRVGLLLLLPLGVGLARYFTVPDSSARVRPAWLIALAAIFCVAEQGRSTPAYDRTLFRARVDQLVSKIDPARCSAFYHAPARAEAGYLGQIDAMWASLETGVPTINGYSGNTPPGWKGFEPGPEGFPPGQPDQHAWLASWVATNGLDPARICWLD